MRCTVLVGFIYNSRIKSNMSKLGVRKKLVIAQRIRDCLSLIYSTGKFVSLSICTHALLCQVTHGDWRTTKVIDVDACTAVACD